MRFSVLIYLLLCLPMLACETLGEDVTPPDAEQVTDIALDTFVASDLGSSEVSSPDATSECEAGQGCFGELCGSSEDCLTGICTMHLGEQVCSRTCDESCPDGFACTLVQAGADGQYVCMSKFSHLCLPCAAADACTVGKPNACVHYPNDAKFCGGACDADNPCPTGFECQQVETASGTMSFQCVAETGVCECSQLAVDSSASTPCRVSNGFGECSGERTCTEDGLGPCNAPEPSEEACNGIDDDCDGQTDEASCDDGNSCTTDACEGEAGCVNTLVDGGECLDGDPCTAADHCEEGQCIGTPVNCDDENPCTKSACDGAGGCTSEPAPGPCDDGDPCTVGDLCQEGACVANVTLQCDDGNPCTTDSCGADGCIHEPTSEPCDDGNPCTTASACVAGACVASEAANCDDENPCTADACDLDAGCVSTPNSLPCDDGSICTQGDACAAGSCVPGLTQLACDDGNGCTEDICDGEAGCLFTPSDGPCDDMNPCTSASVCSAGACVGSESEDCDDGNDCTSDGCDPTSGCIHADNSLPCDDESLCTVGDQCGDGGCQPGASELPCVDGNPCTNDACDEALGCIFVTNDDGCDDLNECTVGDVCVEGACMGTGSLACDDQNPCTIDSCLPDGGCSHSSAEVACDDGDACTVNDMCVAGSCTSGVVLSCDDGNPCTDQQCELGDCVFEHNEAGCDDGNACTDNSQCAGGACVGTSSVICADDNPCTDSGCDPAAGCVLSSNEAPCDDGSVCSLGDQCVEGSCQSGGGQLACDDGSVCTEDSCDANAGCIFEQTVVPCCAGGTVACGEACVNTQVDSSHCGLCGVACGEGEVCSGGSCASICGEGQAFCGGTCVDTDTSAANCGTCGVVCPSQPNTAGVCEAASCSLVCMAGYADCNQDMADGCETHTGDDLSNCGVCGLVCEDTANGLSSCVNGSCALTECDEGYGNCDGSLENGCETVLSSDSNCGACGNACSETELCQAGQCTGSPTNFAVYEVADVTYAGHAYLLLKVGFHFQESMASNWCEEYQDLCSHYGYSPTGCGPSWGTGGYGTCKSQYGSVAPDNSLSCNPSGSISQIAQEHGYGDANGSNSFGFHYCDANTCNKDINQSSTALSYISPSQTHGYTVCIK